MPNIIEITDFHAPELDPYARLQITGPAAEILTRCGDAPIYTADRELLAALTGYELTRGVLCAFQRPKPRSGSGSPPQGR